MNTNIKNKYTQAIFNNNQVVISQIENDLKNILLRQDNMFKNHFNNISDTSELRNAKKVYDKNKSLDYVELDVSTSSLSFDINFNFYINENIVLGYSLDREKNISFSKIEISKNIKNPINRPVFIKAILEAENRATYEIRDYNECNRITMSDTIYKYSTYEPSLHLISGVGINKSFNRLAEEHPEMIMEYLLSDQEISKDFLELKSLEKDKQYNIDFSLVDNVRINVNKVSMDYNPEIKEKSIVKRILKLF